MVAAGKARFDIDVSGAERNISGLRRLERDAPDLTEVTSRRVAKFFAQEVSRYIRQNMSWTGDMAKGVRQRQRKVAGRFASGYEVFVNAPMENGRGDYAAWNQYADSGHWVSISPENYPINEWAQDVGLGENVGSIFVTPQPFMQSPVRRAIKRMTNYVNQGGSVPEFLDQAGF